MYEGTQEVIIVVVAVIIAIISVRDYASSHAPIRNYS
jgi:hypothetical protein